MPHSVLVVEDEPEIKDMLRFTLRRGGFEVATVESAESALAALASALPDLVIIDWMLPGMSGVELARRIRRDPEMGRLPLIMLTARGEERDKLLSFDSGIDDYVTKPFSPKELNARIRALLRRSGVPAGEVIDHGRLVLDLAAHRVRVDGEPLEIGPTEYRMLAFFMRHPERAFTRAQLIDRIWGHGVYVDERTVDVHVLRLRKLLRPQGLDGVVETVRGVGYRYRAP